MVCNDRQLSDLQREAGFDQLRNAGVQKAIRPFSGPATPENLVDYLNREVYPVLRQARTAVNEIYRQVTDQAPSGNPLFHIFSTDTAATDPGAGFIKLNNATQENATVIRISQNNAILRDITPWLDVMSGSSTAPLGVVTLFKGNDPSRYLRFDLNTMTDQGAYWDLAVGIVESSHDNPFVADDQVVTAFIPGVASTGTTVPVGSLAPIAAETFLGNFTGAPAAPAARAGTLVAGGGLTYAAGGTLAVGAGTRITVNADDVQLAAGAADSFLGNFTAGSAVADYRAGGSVAGAGLTYTTGGTLAVGAGTGLTVNANDVQISTITAESFFGNFTGVVAVPVARTGTSVAGAGLTYTAGGTLAVGAGTRITVNADDVQLAAGAAESFLGNFTAGSAVADYRAGSSVAGAGLTYTAGGTLAVGAGTNVTVNANDVAVTNFPLTGLANQAAETFNGNFTAGSAPPTARAGSSVAGGGLTYTAGGTLAVGAGTRITVNADDVQLAAGAAESFLMNATAGSAVADYRAGSSVAGNGLTYTAGGTLAVGAGAGITVAADSVAVNQGFSPTWTGSHTFAGTGTFFSVNVDNASAIDVGSTFSLISSGGSAFNFGADSSITSAGSLDIFTTTDLTLDADGNVFVLGSGILQVGDGTIEGFIRMQADTASTPSVSSNEGMYWVFDPGSAATLPFFTDDANVDHELAYAADVQLVASDVKTSNSAATNATTNLTCVSHTVAANDWSVGSLYVLRGWFQFAHTAAATPTLTIDLLVGGTLVETFVVTPVATALTWNGSIEAVVCCRSTGAGGTMKTDVQCTTSAGTNAANVAFGSTVTADRSLNTTVSNALLLRMRMTTAVASNTLTVVQGWCERKAG